MTKNSEPTIKNQPYDYINNTKILLFLQVLESFSLINFERFKKISNGQ